MRISKILLFATLFTVTIFAAEFKGYSDLSKSLKEVAKKEGNIATTADVKKALKDKSWAVVDVRTAEEWAAAFIVGSYRVGREAPEKALENIVLDDDEKFVKTKLVVVCNTASRAAINAETFRQMGFDEVKIYGINQWIDECNPVSNRYSSAENKSGTKKKFGSYFAEHCKK